MAKKKKKKKVASGRRSRASRSESWTIADAKERLDKLIKKSKDILHKPIGVAEVLFRSRTEGLELGDREAYRRKSDRWSKAVVRGIRGFASTSNSRYWDQLFDKERLPPGAMVALGKANEMDSTMPVVETYIYAHLDHRLQGIKEIIEWVNERKPKDFNLQELIDKFFHDQRLKNSIDKLYEVLVYSLFEVVARRIDATVRMRVDHDNAILKKFDDMALEVLGVNSGSPSIEYPARLFRVGRANASDGGLDMWANFGPAVQVKHLSLTKAEGFQDICDRISADRIVIVCKDAVTEAVNEVLEHEELKDRVQGVITESMLCEWWDRACSLADDPTMGADLLQELVEAIVEEFSVAGTDGFIASRGYRLDELPDDWSVTGVVEEGGDEGDGDE
jgi:hypothetical protein